MDAVVVWRFIFGVEVEVGVKIGEEDGVGDANKVSADQISPYGIALRPEEAALRPEETAVRPNDAATSSEANRSGRIL